MCMRRNSTLLTMKKMSLKFKIIIGDFFLCRHGCSPFSVIQFGVSLPIAFSVMFSLQKSDTPDPAVYAERNANCSSIELFGNGTIELTGGYLRVLNVSSRKA